MPKFQLCLPLQRLMRKTHMFNIQIGFKRKIVATGKIKELISYRKRVYLLVTNVGCITNIPGQALRLPSTNCVVVVVVEQFSS